MVRDVIYILAASVDADCGEVARVGTVHGRWCSDKDTRRAVSYTLTLRSEDSGRRTHQRGCDRRLCRRQVVLHTVRLWWRDWCV